jgi:hypothetical protein
MRAPLRTGLLLFAALLYLAPRAEAHHTALRFNLEEMAAASEVIFYGQCGKIEETYEALGGGKVPITTYSFTVSELLAGKSAATLSFKVLGHAAKAPTGKADEIRVGGKVWSKASALHDLPTYEVGQEYVIFLSAPDSWGLQVPVGRSQGSFRVTVKSDGTRDVRNSLDNRSLFSAPFTGFALQKGATIFPEDTTATVAALVSIPDIDTLIRRRGPLDLEIFLAMTRTVVRGL